MASYEITYDSAGGMLVCRVHGAVPDAEARVLSTEMLRAMSQARSRHGAIRMLFVNQAGVSAFSTDALRPLAEQIQRQRRPGDRTAVVVANSLDKLYAKQAVSGDSQVFISESAAMTWLDAWQHKAA